MSGYIRCTRGITKLGNDSQRSDLKESKPVQVRGPEELQRKMAIQWKESSWRCWKQQSKNLVSASRLFTVLRYSSFRILTRLTIVSLLCLFSTVSLFATEPKTKLQTKRIAWPTYHKDNARSASTDEILKFPLKKSWEYTSVIKPVPAWPGPSKWDGWGKVFELKDRIIFDKVFHVVVASGKVYFGSSVDNQVYCLDAKTGEVNWKFFTEGPVRLAPSIANGRVYFGSDDGFAYSLQAESGVLIWRQQVGPKDVRVPGNGRLISKWPVRSGVVIVGSANQGVDAYCCAGVFPNESVYLVGMNADDGQIQWKTEIKDLTAQGYMLASENRLYVTTGRERPLVFDRQSGKRLFQVAGGGGGTYALLSGDALIYGPGKKGEVNLFGQKVKDQLASFAGNHMVVTPAMSYLHTDTDLTALDRSTYLQLTRNRKAKIQTRDQISAQLKAAKEAEELRQQQKELTETQKKHILTDEQSNDFRQQLSECAEMIDQLTAEMKKCFKWKINCDYPLSLIRTGNALFTGGHGSVAAFSPDDGRLIWQAEVDGDVYGLAVSETRLYVSTNYGKIYCFLASQEGI